MRLLKLVLTALAALALPVGAAGREMRFPNPLSQWDTPDPAVLRHGELIYTYSTGRTDEGGNFPIRRSRADDRTSWTEVGSVLTSATLPVWTNGIWGFWAPEVHQVGERYVCYFSAPDANGRYCVGAATAPSPEGPFQPLAEPLVRNEEIGVIDASYFMDPATSRSYLLWKEDRNDLSPQEPTGMLAQELESDGLTLKGKARVLVANDEPWEGPLVEAPSIILRKGWYYLFFTGNVYTSDDYAVGVARSRHVLGPYEKYERNPILKSSPRFGGPGHQFLFEESPGRWTMFYHSRDNFRLWRRTARLLMSDPVNWTADGWPKVSDGYPSLGW